MEASAKQHTLSDYALRTIHHKARQLVGRAGFTKDDVKDIEQEMAADLVERLQNFNPDKACQDTFVAKVVEHHFSKLIRRQNQEMRDYRRAKCSLNDLVHDAEGETTERVRTIAQDEADILAGKRNRTREDEAHLCLDVSSVIASLPDDLRKLSERLKTQSITEASRSLGIPRQTLYEARSRLKLIFGNAGLKRYL